MEPKYLWTNVDMTDHHNVLYSSYVRCDDKQYWALQDYRGTYRVDDLLQQQMEEQLIRARIGGDKKIHLIEKN